MNHSLSENFVSWCLKLSHVLAVFQLAWMPTLSQSIRLCLALSNMSRFLWHNSVWVCRFGWVLQYISGDEALACSIDSDFNNVIVTFWLHPSFAISVITSLQQCLDFEGKKVGKRLVNQVDHYAFLCTVKRVSHVSFVNLSTRREKSNHFLPWNFTWLKISTLCMVFRD